MQTKREPTDHEICIMMVFITNRLKVALRMNRTGKYLILALLFLPFLYQGCATKDMMPTIQEVREVTITGISKDTLSFNVRLLVKNGNDFEVNVHTIRAEMIYKDTAFGTSSFDAPVSIPSNTSSEIEFPVSICSRQIQRLFSGGEDTLKILVKGTAIAATIFSETPVELEMEYALPLAAEILKGIEEDAVADKLFKIENAYLKSMGLSHSVLSLEFSIVNHYGLDFTLKNYPNTISINGNNSGTGVLEAPIEVKEDNTVVRGVMEVTLNNLSSITSVFGSIFSGKLTYTTEGILELFLFGHTFSVPFRHTGTLLKLKD